MVGSQLSVAVRVGCSAPFLDPVLGPSHLMGRRQAGDLRRRAAVTGVGAFGLGQLSRGAHVGGIGEYRRERHPLLFVVAVMAYLLVRVAQSQAAGEAERAARVGGIHLYRAVTRVSQRGRNDVQRGSAGVI
jgi:hypothetical protein